MAERNEADIVAQAPVNVTLGGKDYLIKPLVIKYSREWKQKAVKVMSAVPGYITDNPEKEGSYEKTLMSLLVDFPHEAIDLFFEWARDLKREEIEEIASDAEIAVAFSKILEVAFPLTKSLPKALGKLYQ